MCTNLGCALRYGSPYAQGGAMGEGRSAANRLAKLISSWWADLIKLAQKRLCDATSPIADFYHPSMILDRYSLVVNDLDAHCQEIKFADELVCKNASSSKWIEKRLVVQECRKHIKAVLSNGLLKGRLVPRSIQHPPIEADAPEVDRDQWRDASGNESGLNLQCTSHFCVPASGFPPRDPDGHSDRKDRTYCLNPGRKVDGFVRWRTSPSVEQAPSQKHAKSSAYGADDEQVSSCDRFLHGCQCSPDVVGRSLVRALRKWGAA